MKTNYFKMAFVSLFAVVALCSCSKDEDNEDSKSTACEILSFSVNGEEWDISGTNITHSYPAGTEETSLTPVIKLSPGATVNPSANGAQDFFTERGVTYTVIAEDGATKKTYAARASLQIGEKSVACEILSFSVNGEEWDISGTNITHSYPAGTEKTSLTPAITLSPGATANPSSNTPQDFFTEQGVTYIVTAEDGTTKKTYIARATAQTSGVTGDCTWTLAATANYYTLTISGNGAMADYAYWNNSAPWYQYRNDINAVVIQDGVTTIGKYAFDNCDELTSVTIPSSVTTIGDGAFVSCTGLTGVTIPNSVITIGGDAFLLCSSLTNVSIGNSVTTIGRVAFRECNSLTSVTIPNSVITIGEYAFFGCSGLTSVSIGSSVTTIGEGAFDHCSSLTSVTIPNSVTTIGKWAFVLCSGLASISIGNSVTTIGEEAFAGCSDLTSVTIPNSVTTIISGAFAGCSSLTTVINLSTVPQSISEDVFSDVNTKACTLKVPASAVEDYKAAPVWREFGNITAN